MHNDTSVYMILGILSICFVLVVLSNVSFAYTSLFVFRNDVIITTKRRKKNNVPRCSTSVICQQSGLSLITITGLIHLYGTVFKNWIVFQICSCVLMHHPYLGLKGCIAFTAIAYFIILALITKGSKRIHFTIRSRSFAAYSLL